MTTKLAVPTVLKTIFDRKVEEVAERLLPRGAHRLVEGLLDGALAAQVPANTGQPLAEAVGLDHPTPRHLQLEVPGLRPGHDIKSFL